jgi:riboflavin kinase / FMN adenylyltransferase
VSVYRSLAEIPADAPASAVAIGKFDGVHGGHRAVLAALVADARERGLRAVVVTFDRNPLALLAPERSPASLVGLDQKLELLQQTGVDDVLVLAFDAALAALTPREFATSVLRDALNARLVLVGEDFRFGVRGSGDVDVLRELGAELGWEVDAVGDVVDPTGARASSSSIRDALTDGDIELATAMLGRPPRVRGRIVRGFQRGRELGYPTANMQQQPDGFVPAEGVYAGWLVDHDAVPAAGLEAGLEVGPVRYPAAISIGSNPTFDDVTERQIEAYVIDRELDLYDHLVDIEFASRIRGMVAFEGIDALIARMALDVDEARVLTAGASANPDPSL